MVHAPLPMPSLPPLSTAYKCNPLHFKHSKYQSVCVEANSLLTLHFSLCSFSSHFPNMSSVDCGNCDCADKTQCTKKRNTFQVEGIVETSYNMGFFDCEIVDGENDCKCGPGCNCGSCPCHK
eukprot:Gb_31121 [translate_table: standard]